jgi:hypothetical protein
MRSTRSRLLTAVCVFLLLFAQFGALTHAVWHAHAGIHTHHADDNGAHDDEHPSGQAALCAFDLAFGQVLGGVQSCGALAFALAPAIESFLDLPASRLHAEALSPKSRGPPILL